MKFLMKLANGIVLWLLVTQSYAKNANDALLCEVDSILKEIDAVHQHGGAAGEQLQKQRPASQAVAPTIASAISASAPLKKLDPQSINLAKQQIQAAEAEIAKLKAMLARLEPSELKKKEAGVQRIRSLSAGLKQTYDKTIQSYEESDVADADEQIALLKNKIAQIDADIDLYDQELNAARSVQNGKGHGTATGNAKKPRPGISLSPQKNHVTIAGSDVAHGSLNLPIHELSEFREGNVDRDEIFEKAVLDDSQEHRAYGHAHGWHFKGLDPALFTTRMFGFVKAEPFFSTRMMRGLQENFFAMLPDPRFADAENSDINAQPQVYGSGMHAHFGLLCEGPTILKAKPSVDISAEYWGPLPINYFEESVGQTRGIGNNVNLTFGTLLIHAAVYLDWDKNQLIAGQAWHPVFDPAVACSNDKVSYVSSLADPLIRAFQLRLTQKIGNTLDFFGAFLAGIDCKSRKNLLVEDPRQSQNPPYYGFHVQARATLKEHHILAVSAEFETVRPRIFTQRYFAVENITANSFISTQTSSNDIYKTNATASGFSMMGFMRLDFDPYTFKIKTIVGSMLEHPLGGFAVSDRVESTGQMCYTPWRVASLSADIAYKRNIEPGIYMDFSKSLGVKDPLYPFAPIDVNKQGPYLIFRYFPSLDYLLTIAPRLKVHYDPVTFCTEIEYMRAAFGTIRQCGDIDCTVPVDNVRFIFALHFDF